MKEQTKSKSLYIDENNSNKIHLDDFGNPLNGVCWMVIFILEKNTLEQNQL